MHEGGPNEPIGSPTPVRLGERIGALDVYRGLAVLTILLMNIDGFALPFEAMNHPFNAGVRGWLDEWTCIVLLFGFEGTARGAFGLLFGAGVILLTSRLEAKGKDAADIHLRRNMWLIVFGLVHAYALLWFWDILYFYGVTGVFLYVFRKLRPRTLCVWAGVAALPLIVPSSLQLAEDLETQDRAIVLLERSELGETLTQGERETLDAWHDTRDYDADPDEYRELVERYRGGYGGIWVGQAGTVFKGQTQELMLWGIWDGAVFMLTGMALFKLGVLTGARSTRFYLTMALVCYALAAPSRSFTTWLEVSRFDEPAIESWGWVLYQPGRLAMTLGHAALVMLFVRFFGRGLLAYLLAACGRMALTNYVAQTVVCTWLFWGFGLGWFDSINRFGLLGVILAVWTAQLVWSPIWLAAFRFGPLEWAWRSLTYWRLQPILRERARPAEPPPPEHAG